LLNYIDSLSDEALVVALLQRRQELKLWVGGKTDPAVMQYLQQHRAPALKFYLQLLLVKGETLGPGALRFLQRP
jgi:hypothetical protein